MKTFRQAVFPQQRTRLDFLPSRPCLPPGLLAWWKISKGYKDNRKIRQNTINYGPNGYFTSFPTSPYAWGSWEGDLRGSSCKEVQTNVGSHFFTFWGSFQPVVTLTSAGRPLNRQQAASSPQPPFNFNKNTIVNQRWVNTIGFKNLYQIFISNVDPKKVTLHFQMETFKNQSDLYKTLSLFAACWSPWTRPSHMEEGYGSRNSSWRVAFIWLAVYHHLLSKTWFLLYNQTATIRAFITWAVQSSRWTLHIDDSSLFPPPPYLKNRWDCGTLFKVGHWLSLVLQR